MDENLAGYSDSNWDGNMDNRKSSTGFCFKMFINSDSITWASKIQNSIATSSAEFQLLSNWCFSCLAIGISKRGF